MISLIITQEHIRLRTLTPVKVSFLSLFLSTKPSRDVIRTILECRHRLRSIISTNMGDGT
jgi:hypothetical protein